MLDLKMQYFADGGAPAAPAAPASASTDSGSPAPTESASVPAIQTKADKNGLSNVKYGLQDEPMQEQAQQEPQQTPEGNSQSEPNARPTFDELVKGEYKKDFDARVQRAINQRFKQMKTMESRMEQMQRVIDSVSGRYNIDPSNVEQLQAAIDADESYYEDEADKLGIPVEQYKVIQRLKNENARLTAQAQERERQSQADEVMHRWQVEGYELAKVYNNFDLEAECSGPDGDSFISLLQNGIDMRTAYEVIHHDELMSNTIKYTVEQTQKRTMDSIRARGTRPPENGSGGNAATQIAKPDPAKWTRADMKEIERRVMRGEKIRL